MSDVAVDSLSLPDPAREPINAWRKGIVTLCVSSLLMLGVVAACTETEEPKGKTVAQKREESETLREADRAAELRIAVWDNVPGISDRNRETGEYEGFDIEIAKAMARDLGFHKDRIAWVSLDNLPNRGSILGRDAADMVVASFSMTRHRMEDVAFAGPYLVIPQAVLVHRVRKKPLRTIPDLQAKNVIVCTTTGSTSADTLGKLKIRRALRTTNAQCMKGMRDGSYDAFSTDRHILEGFKQAHKDQFGIDAFDVLDTAIAAEDEKLGIAVPKNDEAMRELVAYFLDNWKRAEEEGGNPWLLAYDRTIGQMLPKEFRSQPDVRNVPDLVDHGSKAPWS